MTLGFSIFYFLFTIGVERCAMFKKNPQQCWGLNEKEDFA